jgi:hypothetical protein
MGTAHGMACEHVSDTQEPGSTGIWHAGQEGVHALVA